MIGLLNIFVLPLLFEDDKKSHVKLLNFLIRRVRAGFRHDAAPSGSLGPGDAASGRLLKRRARRSRLEGRQTGALLATITPARADGRLDAARRVRVVIQHVGTTHHLLCRQEHRASSGFNLYGDSDWNATQWPII